MQLRPPRKFICSRYVVLTIKDIDLNAALNRLGEVGYVFLDSALRPERMFLSIYVSMAVLRIGSPASKLASAAAARLSRSAEVGV